jgi:hypothetical protein
MRDTSAQDELDFAGDVPKQSFGWRQALVLIGANLVVICALAYLATQFFRLIMWVAFHPN